MPCLLQRHLLCLSVAISLVFAAQAAAVGTREDATGSRGPQAEARGAQTAPPGVERLAARAAEAREAGRLDEAMDLYEKALRKAPSWLEGRWALATLFYDKERYEEARGHFEAVARAQPREGVPLALQGLCEAMIGDDRRAVLDLRQALDLGIGVPRVESAARYQAALLTNALGDPDGAFETLRWLAVDDNDDRPPIIELFGLILLRLPWRPKDIPEEKRDMVLLAGRAGFHMARARRSAVGYLAIEELASRYPAQPNVHYAYGMFLLPDDPAAAVEEFRRELRVSPDHHVAMIQLALVELKQGRAAEALPFAEKAAALAPDVPASHVALGRALLAVGQIERGVAEMEAAVRLAPEVPKVRYGLIQAYRRAGRLEDAAMEQKEFQRLQPDSRAGPGEDDESVPSP